MSEAVVSTRIRLARNLRDYPFPIRLSSDKASEIVEKAIELVTTVRGTYPDAKIIFAPTAYYDLIYKKFEKLGGEEAGYYMTSIPMDASGKGGHPSVWGHSSAMTSLMSTIASISGMYE